MTQRILVCGGRDYLNERLVCKILNHYHKIYEGELIIVHGGARGADLLADAWAKRNNIPISAFPVTRDDWIVLGKAAGHIRNSRMLAEGKPDFVLAFPGGAGTANMIAQTEHAHIPLFKIVDEAYRLQKKIEKNRPVTKHTVKHEVKHR